ncbi:DUF4494 family protein [Porphyromonas endodontalis]|uniref:Uncharacterized protein n=1 Tax=Porphyromonas endodontalis (strain ATCC 35406 / DSM 24491 / JCM 8526 / CCUG 16442 / BCRC 14492 / NCTC 13058 / HG 370) TaxID=553175 RepID=C3JB86_POREA|nr:DUF4494 family protein [Porphyromonas endodontalis]EEN82538.1 hypothetical protein POREN0001_1529 [Porphyromonas endodontalis ATCC 35406]UBH64716.1 DUF4494 domain-containing protein [Porphyromonas endodontalis]SUB76816.1 Uncharacterised protein [Porphyromonas endodontalis]
MTTKLHYEVKVRYERIDDLGKAKKVTEVYIVSAYMSHEAEIAMLSELSSYRDVEILSIKQVKIEQVVASYDRDKHRDKWYRARCAVLEYDNARDRTRKVTISVIINADDFDEAASDLQTWRGMMTRDIELLSLSLSSIKGWLI